MNTETTLAERITGALRTNYPQHLALGYLRYETLRKLNPRQFAEIHKRNLNGERFDDMIDQLITRPMNTIPNSPSDMPWEWHNDENAIRNAIMDLSSFQCVDLHWERDDHASDVAGEAVGEWELCIDHGRTSIRASHAEITNCLWFAVTMMDAKSQDAYKRQQEAKRAALAKLTPEDRKALGIAS